MNPESTEGKTPPAKGSSDKVRTRCPHCQAINQVKKSDQDEVFKCTNCEKMFRLRKKVDASAPINTSMETRFPIRCKCGAKMSVTYANFGKQVKCKSCNQIMKIPEWIPETKFTEEEFDDMFSKEEQEEFQKRMANSRVR